MLAGATEMTRSQISALVEDLGRQKYRGIDYHLLRRNCNHFSDEFVQLLCNGRIPRWVNRLADLGSLLPQSLLPTVLVPTEENSAER